MKPDISSTHDEHGNPNVTTVPDDSDQFPNPSERPTDASADPEKGLESPLHQNKIEVRAVTGFRVRDSIVVMKPDEGE